MTKRIFISTNATLYGIFDFDVDNNTKLENSNLLLLLDSDKAYYNGQSFDTISIEESIIVVKDSSTTPLASINAASDFLLHHTNTDDHIANVVRNFEGKKIQGQHPNPYYTDVFKIIFDDNIPAGNKVEKILEVLGFGIEHKKHDANIQLYKSLSLFPLKLKEAWTAPNFIKEINALKEKDGLELVKNKLDAIFFKETVEEFYEQLEPIETEIINFSTAPQ